MNITQELQKWGNSTGIRLPKKVIDAAHLQPNQTLSISLKGKSIVLTPIKGDADFTLQTMLKGVTPGNVHPEVDWGSDVGAEKIDG
ncbi:MAG TPA: AbrB/MazE/SpoVT family DNA-binding domain-containing protein [Candidatus Saccharimonadales bacterium]|nr:AbrB/MazE/SpoVT family DNA-binding domain-containing protein [Candidatus Saccharimonadales bacterium]